MVERVLPVVARDGQEAGGVETLVEGIGEGVADPLQVLLPGTVFEGKHEYEASGGFVGIAACA